MSEYFSIPENQSKLLSFIESWKGTQYQHMGTVKGGAVDCTKFIGLVLVELGIMQQIDYELYYPPDWFVHGKEEVLINSFSDHISRWVDRNKYYIPLLRADRGIEFKFGDVVLFSTNENTRLSNHCSFYLGGDGEMMCHCINRLGVIKTQFLFWRHKATFVYRIYQK